MSALRTSEAPPDQDVDPDYVNQGLEDIEEHNRKAGQISDTANLLKDAEEDAADNYSYDEATFGRPKSGEYEDQHGDKVQSNYNADINDQEQNPDDIPGQDQEVIPKGKQKVKNSLFKRMVMKGGPGGTVLGLLLAGGIGSATLLGPASLLANLSTILGNHTDIGHHLYGKTSNAFVKAIFDGRNCAESTIKCKFRTISESRLQEWRDRGVNVTADRNAFGRYKVRALTFPNGREVTSLRQFAQLRYTDPYSYSLLKKWPIRATYLDSKASVKKALAKFGRSLSDRIASSKKTDKNERVADNRSAMNARTEASTGDRNARLASMKTKYNKYSAKFDRVASKLTSKTNIAAGVGTVGIPVLGACVAYNIIRAAEATSILLWHEELIKFATPFLIAGAQAQQAGVQGGLDWQTAEMFADRLTTGVTEKDVEENPEVYSEEMIGMSAMDSKGFMAALNGDTSSYDGYAEKYTGWAPINHVIGIGVVRQAQELLGTDNIRVGCKAAGYAVWASLAQCFAGPVFFKCLASAAVTVAVLEFWGDDIVRYVTEQVQGPALEAMADANLNSSLHGPPLGQALASASGVLASYSDRSSYFAAAGTPDEAFAMEYDMQTDPDYINSQIAEAKQNQFNTANKYSFVSQMSSRLGIADWNGSFLSALSSIPSTVASGLSSLTTVRAEKAGLYQPIEIFHTRQQFDKTLENCTSPGLRNIQIPCLGESGRASPYILPEIQNCLDREESDPSYYCIDEAIDYLNGRKYGKDNKPFIDEKTGKPSDWDKYEKTGEKFDNPVLMFMRYCGEDREYPLGYTDVAAEDDYDDWAIGERCAPSKDGKEKNNDRDLAWISFYLQQCIALLANSEGLDYCWDDAPKSAPLTPSTGDWVTPAEGTCTSPYGPRGNRLHAGIDIANSIGTPVVAPTDVVIASKGVDSGYGNAITARTTDGAYLFRFGHLDALGSRNVGDTVPKGELIAPMGNTGQSTGPHLHFEIYPGGGGNAKPYASSGNPTNDPAAILAEHGVTVSC